MTPIAIASIGSAANARNAPPSTRSSARFSQPFTPSNGESNTLTAGSPPSVVHCARIRSEMNRSGITYTVAVVSASRLTSSTMRFSARVGRAMNT